MNENELIDLVLSTLYNNLDRKGLRISKHILEPKGINLEWDEVLKPC